MLSRRITVRIPNKQNIYTFAGLIYEHGDAIIAMPEDRWYALRDLRSFVNEHSKTDDTMRSIETESKPWEALVRQYNTTLMGLSYHERRVKVLPNTRFVNAASLRRITGWDFE